MNNVHLDVNRLHSEGQAEQTLSTAGSSSFHTSNPTGIDC